MSMTTAPPPNSDALLDQARQARVDNDHRAAYSYLSRAVDLADTFVEWQAAARCLDDLEAVAAQPAARTARVAVLGTYTTGQLVQLLRVAGFRQRVDVRTYEAPYGQVEQQIIDADSALYGFDPDVVVVAAHAGALRLPSYSDDPAHDVESETQRWTALWETLWTKSRATIVQHTVAPPPTRPFGNLTTRLPGTRARMIASFNDALAGAAGDHVGIVDCQWLASSVGNRAWFDDRYWHLAKQAVAPACIPLLARHTAAVIAAMLGLSRKCVVVDLDNTLWGGIVGEDGVAGLRIGDGAAGEAYAAFQDYLLELQRRGVLLAVSSKNNHADAVEVFERHLGMRLDLHDIAAFVANWEPKPDNLRRIAETLNIGLDALVFVDDNPAEREAVRQLVPEVEVVELPEDPAGYRAAIADCVMLEPASFTVEDTARTAQYRARAAAADLERSASSLEDFWRSLDMHATVAPFDELHLPRIVQLTGKTNQFNLTTRRHSRAEVQAMMADRDHICHYLELRDRFTDHGLVGVLIARREGDALDIDTWLMSCRVIGRTADAEMLMHLSRTAQARGCRRLLGTYIPTAKNGLVATRYGDLGFELIDKHANGTTRWAYDLAEHGPIYNEFCGNG